mgnify:CR=1 FL=1
MTASLDRAPVPPANLLLREAHLLDPRAGLDGPADLLIRDGQIAALGEPGTLEAPDGGEVVEAQGSGDDAIVEVVREARPWERVVVVTADRGLRERVSELGAEVMGPRWLLTQLGSR